jgi:hypothetical protein
MPLEPENAMKVESVGKTRKRSTDGWKVTAASAMESSEKVNIRNDEIDA